MGATTPTLTLQGVSGAMYSISLYFAGGDAAGYRVPSSQYLAAAATSNTRWTVPEPCRIISISGPATGVLRVLADGIATPILINTAVVIASIARSGQHWGQLAGMRQGRTIQYELAVEVAMAA